MPRLQLSPRKWAILVGLALGIGLLGLGAAVYAVSGGYDGAWWVAAGGGGYSQGLQYQLSGTLGQSATGELTGGNYSLAGGFWPGAGSTGYVCYLPLARR